MSGPIVNGDGPLIDCRSVWKVFGAKSDAAIRAIDERGLGKTEVLKEFGCVVGVANVSLSPEQAARSSASWACRAAASPR